MANLHKVITDKGESIKVKAMTDGISIQYVTVCHKFKDSGECPRGDKCYYQHDLSYHTVAISLVPVRRTAALSRGAPTSESKGLPSSPT
jgi:hypothetical protein